MCANFESHISKFHIMMFYNRKTDANFQDWQIIKIIHNLLFLLYKVPLKTVKFINIYTIRIILISMSCETMKLVILFLRIILDYFMFAQNIIFKSTFNKKGMELRSDMSKYSEVFIQVISLSSYSSTDD